jgi:superfamily II DNA or RNA helicase
MRGGRTGSRFLAKPAASLRPVGADIVLDSRIRVGGISEDVALEIRKAFSHENPKRKTMQARKQKGWWNEPAAYFTWSDLEGGGVSVPRGGMKRVREVLQNAGMAWRVRDAREPGHPVIWPERNGPLWPHQELIVRECSGRENCLAKSSTGSGKTSALLGLLPRLNTTTLVIVHTNALGEQWAERANKELGIPARDVGVLGGGRKSVGDLTIGTVKSVASALERDEGFANRWGAVFADEVHLFAAKTFYDVVDRFPARYRIGVSDDQRRKDRKEFLIHDLFGDVAVEVTHEEMIEAGHVMDVEVFVIPTDFEAPWYSGAEPGENPDYTRLLSEMAADPARNALIEGVLRRELEERRQVLVFAREREHCRVLGAIAARYASAGYLVGGPGADRQEFRRTKEGLRSGAIRAAVGTLQACGTGVDLPGVEVGFAALPILSNRQAFRQARGRICRRPEGKTIARFYVLWDRRVFGMSHVQNAASWNESTYVWDGADWAPAKAWIRKARMKREESA